MTRTEHSMGMNSLARSFHGEFDIIPADGGNPKNRSNLFIRSVLASLILHAIFFYAFINGPHQVPPHLAKESHHWVVSLVSEWKVDPKSSPIAKSKEEMIAIPQEMEKGKLDFPTLSDGGFLQPAQATGDTEFLISPLSHPATSITLSENPHPLPETSGSLDRKRENSLGTIEDRIGKGIQIGQLLYPIKIREPFAVSKIKYFQMSLKAYLEKTLQTSLPEEDRQNFQGKKASARIDYSKEAEYPAVVFAEDSDLKLAAFLAEKIDWAALSAPSSYGLPHKIFHLHVTFTAAGEIAVWISLL